MRLNKTLYSKSHNDLSTTLLVKVISFVMLRIQMFTYVLFCQENKLFVNWIGQKEKQRKA